MSEQIKDGSGTGNLARVNANNRLYSNAVTIDENLQATKIGNSYNINTGAITLTDAARTPIIYLQNNENQPLHISAIAVGLGPTTGGSGGIPNIFVVRNPTGGTIISGATAVSINSNRNYGSANTLTADAYSGGTGVTLTGGVAHRS